MIALLALQFRGYREPEDSTNCTFPYFLDRPNSDSAFNFWWVRGPSPNVTRDQTTKGDKGWYGVVRVGSASAELRQDNTTVGDITVSIQRSDDSCSRYVVSMLIYNNGTTTPYVDIGLGGDFSIAEHDLLDVSSRFEDLISFLGWPEQGIWIESPMLFWTKCAGASGACRDFFTNSLNLSGTSPKADTIAWSYQTPLPAGYSWALDFWFMSTGLPRSRSSTPAPSPVPGNNLNYWLIGGAIAGVVLVTVAAILGYICYRKHHRGGLEGDFYDRIPPYTQPTEEPSKASPDAVVP